MRFSLLLLCVALLGSSFVVRALVQQDQRTEEKHQCTPGRYKFCPTAVVVAGAIQNSDSTPEQLTDENDPRAAAAVVLSNDSEDAEALDEETSGVRASPARRRRLRKMRRLRRVRQMRRKKAQRALRNRKIRKNQKLRKAHQRRQLQKRRKNAKIRRNRQIRKARRNRKINQKRISRRNRMRRRRVIARLTRRNKNASD